jgi:hypothetical protein
MALRVQSLSVELKTKRNDFEDSKVGHMKSKVILITVPQIWKSDLLGGAERRLQRAGG